MIPNHGNCCYKIISLALILVWTGVCLFSHCNGQVYQDVKKVFDDKLGAGSGYKTTIRPVLNHSEVTHVTVSFALLAIVDLEAIKQEFVVNGVLGMAWDDQLVAWNSTQYNNVHYIRPDPKEIWRPRVILANTMESRDLFGDDYSPITAQSNGRVTWYPGGLFHSSCKLNLYRYPFDEQQCQIEMYAMGLNIKEIVFLSHYDKVGTKYMVESGAWRILSTRMEVGSQGVPIPYPFFKMVFKLKRRPGFVILNIVIPIVLMSVLNILVFVIPADSKEKISYSITVLLAIVVFMSIVSGQLPRSSDTLPVVTVYLLVLTVISVCTVIVTITIVFCFHREEEESKNKKTVPGFKSAFNKYSPMNGAARNVANVKVKPAATESQFSNIVEEKTSSGTTNIRFGKIRNIVESLKDDKDDPCPLASDCDSNSSVNRWRLVGKHLDCISFVVFTIIWISVTIGFLVEMAR